MPFRLNVAFTVVMMKVIMISVTNAEWRIFIIKLGVVIISVTLNVEAPRLKLGANSKVYRAIRGRWLGLQDQSNP
jgi:hypothetical protein